MPAETDDVMTKRERAVRTAAQHLVIRVRRLLQLVTTDGIRGTLSNCEDVLRETAPKRKRSKR